MGSTIRWVPAIAAVLLTVPLAAANPKDGGPIPSVGIRPEPPVAIDMSILPSDRRTEWAPGIPGGIPAKRDGFATLTGLSTDGTGDNTQPINDALAKAHRAFRSTGTIQEVVLPAGTIRVAGTIVLGGSGVVLRGQGMRQTRIRYDGDGHAIRLGRGRYTDFGATHGPWNLHADALRGAREIVLANADASKVRVGDILVIDQEDDPSYVRMGNARYEKRQANGDTHGPPLRAPGLWRSVTSMIRVVARTEGAEKTTTFRLAEPLHMDFRRSQHAQVFQVATEHDAARPQLDGVHFVGVEDLYFTGGVLGTNNVAYCWVKNVEADGDPGTPNVGKYDRPGGISGRSVDLFHAYRCEVRGSYIHHSRSITQGGGAYLLSLSSYTSETLIEDNIVVYGNKLIVGNMMGGGNVIAYNYVDNARTNHETWQEGAIDLNHQSFTHHALVEGNWATNLTSDTTHGNAGWHVFFRNFATGQNSNPVYGAHPYVRGSPDGGYRRAAGTDGFHREATYIGNVLLAGSGVGVYQIAPTSGPLMGSPAVWRVGWGVDGEGGNADDGTALRLLYRHGNWDSVTEGAVWDPTNARRVLPASLYLRGKPAFFGEEAWPWVDATGAAPADRVKRLPAKVRYDALMKRP